jgi:hypothetical protein
MQGAPVKAVATMNLPANPKFERAGATKSRAKA